MKNISNIFMAIICLLFASCGSVSYVRIQKSVIREGKLAGLSQMNMDVQKAVMPNIQFKGVKQLAIVLAQSKTKVDYTVYQSLHDSIPGVGKILIGFNYIKNLGLARKNGVAIWFEDCKDENGNPTLIVVDRTGFVSYTSMTMYASKIMDFPKSEVLFKKVMQHYFLKG